MLLENDDSSSDSHETIVSCEPETMSHGVVCVILPLLQHRTLERGLRYETNDSALTQDNKIFVA